MIKQVVEAIRSECRKSELQQCLLLICITITFMLIHGSLAYAHTLVSVADPAEQSITRQMVNIKVNTAATTATIVPYFGYTDTILLENKHAKVVIAPSIGGKILEYSIAGKNSLVLDSREKGWLYANDPNRENLPMHGAGRFDIGPSNIRKQRNALYFGPWQAQIEATNIVKLTSMPDQNTGLQLTRTFHLADHSSKLTITHSMTNIGQTLLRSQIWTRTLTRGKGVFVIPINKGECIYYPKCYATTYQHKLELRPDEDFAVNVTTTALSIEPSPVRSKFAIESYAGWFAYLLPNNTAVIREFDVNINGIYPDLTNGVVSVYYDNNFKGHAVVELEPSSQLFSLAPQETKTFSEAWRLVDFPFDKRVGSNANDLLKQLTKLK